MKHILITSTLIATGLFLTSCDNPADATTDATVSESKEAAIASDSATSYVFTPESVIKFTGSKVTGSHSGNFKSFTGGFKLADGEPVSGQFTIDMKSLTSDNEKFTAHLLNEDFFNVPKYPESKFVVTSFEKKGEDAYEVSGNLTMLETTKNISFPAKVNQTDDKVMLSSTFDIPRKDWGVVYAGKPDDLIRNEVVIELNLVAKAEK